MSTKQELRYQRAVQAQQQAVIAARVSTVAWSVTAFTILGFIMWRAFFWA